MPPVESVACDFGLAAAIDEAAAGLASARELLALQASGGGAAAAETPFHFDSGGLCLKAYAEALARVGHRFWATTFLSSAFWTSDGSTILDANLRMLAELRGCGVVPRRLFLLQLPAEQEIQRARDERILLQKFDDRRQLAHLDRKSANLCRNVESLVAHGCEVRVLHDEERLYLALPARVAFDPMDSELAIYDDWRFDVFRGGLTGTIEGVRCFTPVMAEFPLLRDGVADYFAALWSRAQPILPFLDRVRKVHDSAAERVDYQLTWLARYDHGLPEEDKLLKVLELHSVKVALKGQGRWGTVRRFLDIGTCTGRYPLSCREAVRPDGEIIGIDNDLDCVRFARLNVLREAEGEHRIRIERQDFCDEHAAPEGPFDLVTCMLGTLLHFERNGDGAAGFDDPLQRALERVARLLAPDGLFFFSVWSERACSELRLLSIYSLEDKKRLARWTPGAAELQARLRAAGLDFAPPQDLEGRMDFYCCRLG